MLIRFFHPAKENGKILRKMGIKVDHHLGLGTPISFIIYRCLFWNVYSSNNERVCMDSLLIYGMVTDKKTPNHF